MRSAITMCVEERQTERSRSDLICARLTGPLLVSERGVAKTHKSLAPIGLYATKSCDWRPQHEGSAELACSNDLIVIASMA